MLSLSASTLLGFLSLLSLAAQAQQPPTDVVEVPEDALPVVRARASLLDAQAGLPPDRALTVLDATRIARQQSENIFDILKDVPGVGVVGGPRPSGMRFTLRGFSDNEDVLFKIDGAVKGFEKYRFGGGVFLEPELLKSLSVERGPAISSGSGALGGTISATTKSAADLLKPGQRVGALAKLGYNDNNNERLRMLAVYGRPSDQLDLIAAIVKRDSGDLRLPDGKRLKLSATHAESRLVKLGFAPADNLLLELGHTEYLNDPELTPYDATGGTVGVGGAVRRSIDDANTNLRLLWEPSERFKLRGILSQEKTHLHDHHVRGESRICAGGNGVNKVEFCDDYWEYDIVNGELFADMKAQLGTVAAELSLGLQGLRNSRDVRRISSRPALNEQNWPGGFNGDQPPGDKTSAALIADSKFTWDAWALSPGIRWDRYTVSAQGGTRANMLREGQSPEISFSKAQPAVALTWQIPASAFALTGRYNQAFRPPLIDQYFRDGSGNSAGQSGLCMRTWGQVLAGGIVTADTIQPFYDRAGLGKRYDPALDHASLSGICGAHYRPQESINRELTLAWAPAASGGSQWYGRLTHFRIHTRKMLGSLRWVGGANGGAAQPGVEDRRGTELELRYAGPLWFSEFNLATVRRTARDESLPGQAGVDSYSVPPDSASLVLGLRALQGNLEMGWRLRHLADRQAYIADAPTVCAGRPDAQGVGTQYGANLQELFASWQPLPWAMLRASVDNLSNVNYCLASSFAGGVGFYAPGRAAKLSVTLQY